MLVFAFLDLDIESVIEYFSLDHFVVDVTECQRLHAHDVLTDATRNRLVILGRKVETKNRKE